MTNKQAGESTRGWIWISAIAFLLSFFSAGTLIVFSKQLEALGITKNIYYIILVPLGFSSAAFLFGAMKSYATYRTPRGVAYGKLHLAGPVVIFCLVVLGGFIIPGLGKEGMFDIKVRIVSSDRPTDNFNEGKLFMYLGKDTRKEDIHNGEVSFPMIPASFHNKTVTITPQYTVEGYELADTGGVKLSMYKQDIILHLVRTKASQLTHVWGKILDAQNKPLPKAVLDFNSGLATTETNELGNFELDIPKPPGTRVLLVIMVNGAVMFNSGITLSPDVPIHLKIE